MNDQAIQELISTISMGVILGVGLLVLAVIAALVSDSIDRSDK
jgi:hypothetical protein